MKIEQIGLCGSRLERIGMIDGQVGMEKMTGTPANPTIEDEEILFYAAIGKALTQWQVVETGLANIFCALVGRAGDSGLANIAFYSVRDFRLKLTMTNNVVTTRFSLVAPKRTVEWSKLFDSADKRSQKRNFLAHYQLEIEKQRKIGKRCRLRPSPNSLLPDMKTDYDPTTYSTQDIVAFGHSFISLGTDLTAFWEAIR